MQAPNRLGAALAYVYDAVTYARSGAISLYGQYGRPVNTSSALLADMIATGKWTIGDTSVDTSSAIRTAITSAWVYSAVKLIADRLSSAEANPQVKRRVGEELHDIGNHAFERLYATPNTLMTGMFLTRYTVFWMHLLGNAYWFLSTPAPGMGVPEEIWPIPADSMRPLPETLRASRLTGKPTIDYLYSVNGKQLRLPGENVVHFRFPNPFDYWQGLSPLTALMDAVQVDRYQAKYLQGFFGRDNAVPTAIISVPAETNPQDFALARESIIKQFGEGRRSAIIRAGDLSVQTIQQTIQQMELIGGRKFNREEINHVIGIPEGLISGGASGDSRLATEITFARNTTQPLLDGMCAQMALSIAPYYDNNTVITAPSIIPQDRALKVSEYTTYSQDRTIQENRKELNLPPISVLEVVQEINKEREKAGLDPIENALDDISLELMCRVPTRLLAYVSSNTFAAQQSTYDPSLDPNADPNSFNAEGDRSAPPAYANTEQPVQIGDLPQFMNADQQTLQNTGRSYLPAATRIGIQTELDRWKKVALKEAREGRNPGDRMFMSEALPTHVAKSIQKSLHEATLDRVETIFAVTRSFYDA